MARRIRHNKLLARAARAQADVAGAPTAPVGSVL